MGRSMRVWRRNEARLPSPVSVLSLFVSDVWGTEYMCLYTADGYTGEMISCNEGVLEWIKKEDLLKLNLWEGDKIFLKLLQENAPFFSLKLVYKGDELTEAVLNGENLKKS